MSSSPSDELFERMRKAIQRKKYQEMEEIIRDRRYSPDAVGGGDERTNLHTASQKDDSRAINILLGQGNIDPNVETSEGVTPLMLASSQGKIEALAALLDDMRVDPEYSDSRDRTAKDLIPDSSVIKKKKAIKMFEERERRGAAEGQGAKLAIIIGNVHYETGTGLDDLEGAGQDIEEIQALMEASNYTVKIFTDSKNIIKTILDVMTKWTGSIRYFQFFYAGKIFFF